MKTYEQMKKKELIAFIKELRAKADAYDRVCQTLGIQRDILGYVKRLKTRSGRSQ